MSQTNKLTVKENLLIENIITKLEIYMLKNKQNLYNLAATLGFAYQPFYRLIKNRKLPTISTLAMIADHLNCSIEELISDKFFLDVNVINNVNEIEVINKIEDINNYQKSRVYIPHDKYLPHVDDKFFAIKLNNLNINQVEYCKIYTHADKIGTDGIYLVNYQNNIVDFNIISVGNKFVIVESNQQEQRILKEQFQALAKFFSDALLFEVNSSYIQGVQL